MPYSPVLVIGQIFGVLLAVLSFFIYLQKTREKILLTKLLSDILNVIQQAMVGALTGSMLNGIAIFRELVFYCKGKKKWAQSRIWLFVFLLCTGIAAPLFSWQGYISLLPAVGSSLAVIGFYCTKPRQIRIFGILAQAFWVVYSVAVLNLGGILSSSVSMLGGIFGLWKDLKNEKQKNTEEVAS